MLKSLLKGTLILTITGLVTRVIGFVYKIYLSNILGAETLGIYQLVFPVFGICYTLFGAGIQTAASQMTAAGSSDMNYHKNVFIKSSILSTGIALVLCILIYSCSDYIAASLLGEPKCADSLRVLIYAFPLCGVASCVNGCYYGIRKTAVPALSQLIEQIARVLFVYAVSFTIAGNNPARMCIYAVLGIGVGEGVSMLYSLVMIIRFYHSLNKSPDGEHSQKDTDCQAADAPHAHEGTSAPVKRKNTGSYKNIPVYRQLIKLSTPLTANRLTIALLHSIETILIPVMLKKYGMSSSEALSVYGILTGMAMPFILFPSTITNSLAVLLLPTISEAGQNRERIKSISGICIFGTFILGAASTAVFVLFGENLGLLLFHDQTVGIYIETLSFICPLLFLTTTLSSIINGLGKTHVTFIITIIGLSIRIFITLKTIPSQGIRGYLISLLISELVVTALSFKSYRKCIDGIKSG